MKDWLTRENNRCDAEVLENLDGHWELREPRVLVDLDCDTKGHESTEERVYEDDLPCYDWVQR